MPLFQPTILSKYSKNLDNVEVSEAFDRYKRYFLNYEIQENIRHCKEEQFQEGFLRELFVNVLGYTLNPLPNYNLITEQKNAANTKKADGAILVDGEVVGVIELKDGKTTDLGKVEEQAFNYKSQHKSAVYVVISNFEKLRFYIDNAVECQEFNLFNLDDNEFRILYLCLAYKNIERDIPKRIKEESVSNEDAVTKALYRDYSVFKRELFDDILKNNPCEDAETKVLLFMKSQKLLDRLLFIFFAEDSGLLMPNTMLRIISDWEKLRDLDAYTPLYERIKKYFGWLNDGYKGKDFEVFAYNGGLFKSDEVLDNLTISDDVLKIHSRKLSEYDYATEVDVNILGHIFENSLNEIDDLQQQATAKTPSKRKKDGVFYTPQYITKYIVENTVGRLCAEKKRQLGIVDEEYFSDKKRQSSTKKSLLEKLDAYREWLLSITICDPACGSGAFLNAALQFLMTEHALIDEMQAKVTGDSIVFPNIENVILENNLFGVDINEESVEIAKLSLWLRTAQPHRKLSSLNANIKCGNSLISNPEIAGDKAFDWKSEFPQVFEKGGFDVVIGNPPYVNMVNISDDKQRKYYQQNYKTVKNKSDLYSIFTEKSSQILRSDGLLGFIFSNSWMGTESFSAFREFLAKDVKVYKLVELPPDVFEDASVTTVICFYKNIKPNISDSIEIEICKNQKFCSKGFNLTYKQILGSPNMSFSFERNIELNKIKTISLCEIARFSLGIKTSDDQRFVFDRKIDDDCFLMLRGRNFKRWSHPSNNEWLWYKPNLICEKPGGRPRIFDNFVVKQKIVIQDIATEIVATMDDEQYLCNDTINIIYECDSEFDMKYILAMLNSRLVNTWFKKIFPAGLHVKTNQLEIIPIPVVSLSEQKPLISLSDLMLSLNRNLQEKRSRFLRRLQENFVNIKINNALERFDENGFPSFVAELKKQKVKLSLVEQDDWEEYFMKYKTECNAILEKISSTENDINKLVCELYGLNDEEEEMCRLLN